MGACCEAGWEGLSMSAFLAHCSMVQIAVRRGEELFDMPNGSSSQAMRLSWNTQLVSAALTGLDTLLAHPSRFFQAFPTLDLYKVSHSPLISGVICIAPPRRQVGI